MLITLRDIKLFKLYNDLRDAESKVHYMPVTVDMVASDPVKYLDEKFLGIYAKKFLSEGDDSAVFPEGTFVDPATNIKYRTLDICGTVIMLDNFRTPIPKLTRKFSEKIVTCQSGHAEYMYRCVDDILQYIPVGWHIPDNDSLFKIIGTQSSSFTRIICYLINVVHYGYGYNYLDPYNDSYKFKVYNQKDGFLLTQNNDPNDSNRFSSVRFDAVNNEIDFMQANSSLYMPIKLVKDV